MIRQAQNICRDKQDDIHYRIRHFDFPGWQDNHAGNRTSESFMSVSSVSVGTSPNQTSVQGGSLQRANSASAPADTSPGNPAQNGQAIATAHVVTDGMNIVTVVSATQRSGVAAYVAIMNPKLSTSMRVEA